MLGQLLQHARYVVAVLGPASTAGAQFLVTIALVHLLAPPLFGALTLLLLVTQLVLGVSSALLCAPLPLLFNIAVGPHRDSAVRALFAANLVVSTATAVAFIGLGAALGLSTGAALAFAAYAGFFLLRWFARAHAYALHRPWRTASSDLLYSGVLLAGIGWHAAFEVAAPLLSACLLFALAACLSLAPFGADFLRGQFSRVRIGDLSAYGATWRAHSRWALVGVLTTEATANAHAYLVTFLLGPGSFAPLAASSLLIRPVTVAMNALTEYERPRLARQLVEGGPAATRSSVRMFRGALIATWASTTAAAVALLIYSPRLVAPEGYDLSVIAWSGALWCATAAVRVLRMPESALLQSAGQFAPLAMASVYSCIVSVVLALIAIALWGPVASLVAILLGEAVFALLILRATQRWRRIAS